MFSEKERNPVRPRKLSVMGCRGAGIPSGPAAALSQMAQQVGSRLLRRVPGVAREPSSSCAKVAHALGPGEAV